MLLPLLALKLTILNGYLSSGIIATFPSNCWSGNPVSLISSGVMVTTFSTLPLIFRLSFGFFASFVYTEIFFRRFLPEKPVVLIFTVILPSPPGGMRLGKETVVAPQSLFTSFILSVASPLFWMTKSCVMAVFPA